MDDAFLNLSIIQIIFDEIISVHSYVKTNERSIAGQSQWSKVGVHFSFQFLLILFPKYTG